MKEVKLTQAAPDPICTRVSIGGNTELGFYCVYRGSIGSAITATEAALDKMKATFHAGEEPSVDRRFKELGAS